MRNKRRKRRAENLIASILFVSILVLVVAIVGMCLRKWLGGKKGEEENHQTVSTESNQTETEAAGIAGPESEDGGREETEAGAVGSSETGTETIEPETQTGRDTVAEVPEDFSDTLFIGDSRTIGLMQYGDIEEATFFADTGMSVFLLEKKHGYAEDLGKVTFDELLDAKKFGRIYLMLGINELGYPFESLQKKYQEVVEKIKGKQADAVIYLCANLHVTAEQSDKDEIYNNKNVNRVNEMIAGLADNETTFYLDVNELFDDENGCLSSEYASDNFHVYGKYYADWVEWLRTKAA